MDHGAIVVGGGHNGLICAAYLARAGLDVVVLEARDGVGGCAATVDALDGARVNICNCDHTMIRATPVVEELDLAAHGLRYLDVDPAYLCLDWGGGPPWFVFHDVERTLESLRLAYPDQVDGYARYVRAATPIARLLLDVATATPTPGRVAARVARHRGVGLAALLTWSRRSVQDVVRWFFSRDQVGAPMVVTGPAVWGLPPEAPGTGLGALGFAMRHLVPMGRPVGGSGALPDAVAAALRAAGGTVRCSAPVGEVLVEGTAVRGVRLESGEVVEAPIVVVAADPGPLFTQWLGHPPAGAAEIVRRYRSRPARDGYESKLDAVVTAPPRYRAVDDALTARLGIDPAVGPATATAVVSPGLAELSAAHRQIAAGRVAERPMFLANVPSALDPSMRVPGVPGASGGAGHVFSLEVLWTPYAAPGGWASSPEPRRWLDAFATLTHDGFAAGVQRTRVMDPEQYERQFRLARGYAPAYGGTPLAALRGADRELSRYETPIDGLFLTGAATFPGAGVWGASGRNTADAVLRSDRWAARRRRMRRPA